MKKVIPFKNEDGLYDINLALDGEDIGLPSNIGDLSGALSYIASAVSSMTIQAFEPTFDGLGHLIIPENSNGKLYRVEGLFQPVFIEEIGREVDNGDWVGFNASAIVDLSLSGVEVQQWLSDYVTTQGLSQILEDYATSSQVASALSEYTKSDELSSDGVSNDSSVVGDSVSEALDTLSTKIAEVKTFTPWTPEIKMVTGIDLPNQMKDINIAELDAELSGSVVQRIGAIGGYSNDSIHAGLMSDPLVLDGVTSLYFKVDGSPEFERLLHLLGFANAVEFFTMGVSASVDDGILTLESIGMQGVDETVLQVPITLNVNSETEYCISFNDLDNSLTFYVDGQEISKHNFTTNPVVDTVIISAFGSMDGLYDGDISELFTKTEIIGRPTYQIPGLSPFLVGNMSLREIDESKYPQNRNGKGYEIVGLTDPAVWDAIGKEVKNGDFIVFDDDGLPRTLDEDVDLSGYATEAWVENKGYVSNAQIDTDADLAANSDALIPSQKAVKAYVDGQVTLKLWTPVFEDVLFTNAFGEAFINEEGGITLPIGTGSGYGTSAADVELEEGGVYALYFTATGQHVYSSIGIMGDDLGGTCGLAALNADGANYFSDGSSFAELDTGRPKTISTTENALVFTVNSGKIDVSLYVEGALRGTLAGTTSYTMPLDELHVRVSGGLGTGTLNFLIIEEPLYPIDDTVQIYPITQKIMPPENAANNAFILDVADPVFIPELGKELESGDIVFFDGDSVPFRFIPKDAASDGKTYARKNGAWVEVDKPQTIEIVTANKTLTAADNNKILLISADLTITLPSAIPNFNVDIVKMDENFITVVATNGTDKFREDTPTITVAKDVTIFSSGVAGKEYVAIGAY